MTYKKKSLILIILFIISIQIFILVNNKQKTSIRYFIWNIQEVNIGRLICVSFISGLLFSSTLNIILNNNFKTKQTDETNNNKTDEKDNLIDTENDYESIEIPPERDLRDTQPTISVNYRVVKESGSNGDNQLKDRNQKSKKRPYEDDWNNSDPEW